MRNGNGDKKALRRLRGIRTTFRKLFCAFRELVEEVMERLGTACLEWPAPCPGVALKLKNISSSARWLKLAYMVKVQGKYMK